MHKVNIRAQVVHHSHHSHLGFEVNHEVLIFLCILNLKWTVILFLLNILHVHSEWNANIFFIQSGTNPDSKTWVIVILFISLNISLPLITMLLSHCALTVVQLHLVTQSCACWTNVSHNIKETNGLLLSVASTTASNFKTGCLSLLPNIRSTVVWTITRRYDIIAAKLWCWNIYLQLDGGFLVWCFFMIVSVISVLPAASNWFSVPGRTDVAAAAVDIMHGLLHFSPVFVVCLMSSVPCC